MTFVRLVAWALLLVSTLGSAAAQRATSSEAGICSVAARVMPLRELPEGSGVALSRRTPGVLWSHNDSGPPVVTAIDTSGASRGQVQITGARVDDWEDVSVGPCAGGTCLYVADIGDNNRARSSITVYRMPEPQPGDKATAPVEALEAVYPDGPHDAEALFVTGADDLFIVTKAGENGTVLYRFPKPVRPGTRARLERVAQLPIARVTDADASPDGAWVALRNNNEVFFYPARELTSGSAGNPRRYSVKALGEPQGEGVTMGPDGLVYLVGEGRPGTLAALKCALR